MINMMKDAHRSGTLHSEFWKFIGYASATVVMVKQGIMAQASWSVVVMFVAYLAIVAGSNVAFKIVSMLEHKPPADTGSS